MTEQDDEALVSSALAVPLTKHVAKRSHKHEDVRRALEAWRWQRRFARLLMAAIDDLQADPRPWRIHGPEGEDGG